MDNVELTCSVISTQVLYWDIEDKKEELFKELKHLKNAVISNYLIDNYKKYIIPEEFINYKHVLKINNKRYTLKFEVINFKVIIKILETFTFYSFDLLEDKSYKYFDLIKPVYLNKLIDYIIFELENIQQT